MKRLKAKIIALWCVLVASHYVVLTPNRTVSATPKEPRVFTLMDTIATKLEEIRSERAADLTILSDTPVNKSSKQGMKLNDAAGEDRGKV